MSKIGELVEKRNIAEANRGELLDKSDLEINGINAELDKVVHEFIKKVKARFRGVNLAIEVDEQSLNLYLGELPNESYSIRVLQYNKDIYRCNTKLITSETGSKIRDFHIEYFGEL